VQAFYRLGYDSLKYACKFGEILCRITCIAKKLDKDVVDGQERIDLPVAVFELWNILGKPNRFIGICFERQS
jgi:hypothetical protein